MSEIKVAIIGGTGVYDHFIVAKGEVCAVETKYGRVTLKKGEYKDRTVYFVPRHGGGHSLPPHRINYKANIAALKKLRVSAVLATAAVGTLTERMAPGSWVAIDQFIDFTRQRALTFYEGDGGLVVHTDFTEPYCPETRAALLRAGKAIDGEVVDGGCYVCAEGPRFETPAEIKMIKQWGGDLVGMSNVPEVVLAREAGLCYATLALPTNYAAGISPTPLTHEEVLEIMARGKPELDRLLAAFITEVRSEHSCSCSAAGKYWTED